MISRTMMWIADMPAVERVVTRSRFTRPVVDRFVAGYDLEDALAAIGRLNAVKIGGILDLLGEGVTDAGGAQGAADEYLTAVKRIPETDLDTTISVKLTQLGLAFDKGSCIDHMRRLAAEAQAAGTTVEIDMEQSDHVSDTLDVYRLLHADFPDLRIAIQAYLRRTPVDLQAMADLRPKVRLVKGAYAEPVEAAFQKRAEIDRQYAWLTDWLFRNGTDPAIASHDTKLIDHAKATAAATDVARDGFEIQMLYGVRRELQQALAADGYRVRCYVPFGSAWYPYLTRRLAERPANLWFFLRAVARG